VYHFTMVDSACAETVAAQKYPVDERSGLAEPVFWANLLVILRVQSVYHLSAPCPPIDSIMALMTVWRITGKIISTAIVITYAQL